MAYLIIWQRDKFHTIVSEVSSFVGNPVYYHFTHYNLAGSYLWKLEIGLAGSGRNSVSGANHPPNSGIGRGWGKPSFTSP